MEREQPLTMVNERRGRNKSMSEALECNMQLSKTMLHPYSQNRFYVPCTIELRTHDIMRTQAPFNTLRKMTLTHGRSCATQ